ncbi:MAG: 3-hydroxyacyl-CoA dehydrogenase NAD-binding domain-containing protein, partial [Pirellulaceae bacterium]
MSQHVLYDVDNNVAIITIDNPPVNVLQSGIPEALTASINQANQDEALQAIVIIGAGRTFVAGADIKELARVVAGKAELSGALPTLLTAAENSPKPVVAAIHGSCLGGGMELALACHYRVATADAQLGQPEVKIGLIPGAHGTQRLPRLCGISKAAEMCAIGDNISATDAASCGIVDHVVQGNLLEETLAYIRETVIAAGPRKTSELDPGLDIDDETQETLATLEKTVRRRARGQTAPQVAIEAVQWAATLPFAEGVERERTAFHECVNSGQAAGLIHAFFGHRTVNKIPGITSETPRREITQAAVVGAGTMGGGITMAYVNAGIPVTLKEVAQDQLDAGLARIKVNYQRSVDRGRLAPEQLQQRMGLITPTIDYEHLRNADIIVEAVFESLDLKKQVFAELDAVARPGAILATNTSTLDIDQIAGATGRPQDVIGHHFFSPANVMKLLEIVRGK